MPRKTRYATYLWDEHLMKLKQRYAKFGVTVAAQITEALDAYFAAEEADDVEA